MSVRKVPSSPICSGGFTLAELMIVVAIIGILGGIAYPAYEDYLFKGRISEGTAILAAKRSQIEQYFQDRRTYVDAPGCADDSASSENFDFSCTTESADAFTLEATGKGSMSEFSYTLDQSGAKTSSSSRSGWSGSATCWVRKKGGGC